MMDEMDLVRELRPEVTVDRRVLERERNKLMARLKPTPDIQSPPTGVPQIIPQLPYADTLAAIEWLERAFGFREIREARIETPGGAHAEMVLGSGRIMLSSPGGHGAFPPKAEGSPSTLICVYVDDVDVHHANARAAGAAVVSPLEDKFYGDRVYEVLDCEGHRWSFHQHTGRRWNFGEAPPSDGS